MDIQPNYEKLGLLCILVKKHYSKMNEMSIKMTVSSKLSQTRQLPQSLMRKSCTPASIEKNLHRYGSVGDQRSFAQ